MLCFLNVVFVCCAMFIDFCMLLLVFDGGLLLVCCHLFAVILFVCMLCLLHYRTARYSTPQYSTVQDKTAQYSTLQHATVQSCFLQVDSIGYSTFYTVLYNTRVQFSKVV